MKAILLLLPGVAVSFQISPVPLTRSGRSLVLRSSEQGEDDGLVLNDLDQQIGQFSQDLSFSQTDFLAAARKRAEERTASSNAGAGDDDWKNLAEEKKSQYGEIDDWENSQKEAGNADSQILMFTDPPVGEGDDDEDGEGGEPKLLLF